MAPTATVSVVQIEANIGWRYARLEPDLYVATCQPLSLTVQGETFAELSEAMGEALTLLFESLYDAGELAAFLRTKGWTPTHPLPAPGNAVRFDVPFDMRRVPERELAMV